MESNQENRFDFEAPDFPFGPPPVVELGDATLRQTWVDAIVELPSQLRDSVRGLDEAQLNTRYRNWSIRQIVHHVADSHVNSYVRFKWTLTEETPMIKAYDEGLWSNLDESKRGEVGPSLDLLSGLHDRWCQLLRSLSDSDFRRAFVHPESGATTTLHEALAYYAWHGRHHNAQIQWVRENRGSNESPND